LAIGDIVHVVREIYNSITYNIIVPVTVT
jgi:hypothetical protein